MDIAALAREIVGRAAGAARFVVAIAGPPGAGKSTGADALCLAIERAAPGEVAVLPMDGFHFDDAVLTARGDRARKGAPHTFDVAGLQSTLDRLRGDAPVAVPVFDRERELSRAAARIIEPAHRIVLVEGNYLLLDEPPWSALAPAFDLSVILDVPEAELRRRLVRRWLDQGLSEAEAVRRAEGNDLPNARLVTDRSRDADLRLSMVAPPAGYADA